MGSGRGTGGLVWLCGVKLQAVRGIEGKVWPGLEAAVGGEQWKEAGACGTVEVDGSKKTRWPLRSSEGTITEMEDVGKLEVGGRRGRQCCFGQEESEGVRQPDGAAQEMAGCGTVAQDRLPEEGGEGASPPRNGE